MFDDPFQDSSGVGRNHGKFGGAYAAIGEEVADEIIHARGGGDDTLAVISRLLLQIDFGFLQQSSREAVNKAAKVVRQAGGKNIEGPELCVDYSPGYYAVFFEDPDGNKLEICFRESATIAE